MYCNMSNLQDSVKRVKLSTDSDNDSPSSPDTSSFHVSVSSPSEYDSDIDRMLEFYENAAMQEHVFLLETPYLLRNCASLTTDCTSLIIKSGISPTRTFSAGVTLSDSSLKTICFGRFEWDMLINHLSEKCISFFEDELSQHSDEYEPVSFQWQCGDFITLTQMVYDDVKFIHISKFRNGWYLQEETVREILKLNKTLLSPRLSLLESLDFNLYYNNMLDKIQSLMEGYEHILDFTRCIETFCGIHDKCLVSTALREYMYYYENNVRRDVKNKT